MNPTHAHPSAPRSRLNSVVTIRSHRLFNSSAHAYPLRVVLPCVSSSFPILGVSSACARAPSPYRASAVAGHSLYSLYSLRKRSFPGLFPMGSSPIGLHYMPSTLGLVRVGRSYSFGSFGYVPPFQTCWLLVRHPLTPSLALVFWTFSILGFDSGGVRSLRPFPVGRSK